MTAPKPYRPPFPAGLAFRGGMLVGVLLVVGVYLVTKLMTGGAAICL
jgi:hypothetical protein